MEPPVLIKKRNFVLSRIKPISVPVNIQAVLLQLQSISLIQFKNYHHRHFDFHGKMISITGSNGMGKTNLLDAVYYLCFAKSYFHATESLNVLHGHEGFRIEGVFLRNHLEEKITCTFKNSRKEIVLNGEPYAKFSRHLGHFPAVIITPDDAVLINGGSEQRRRFIDTILMQVDTDYLDDLIAYQKILQQRNSLLKNIASGKPADDSLFLVFDEQLSRHGNRLFEKRKTFMPSLIEKVRSFYRQISCREENIDLTYQSSLYNLDLRELLLHNRHRDIQLQRTTDGIHRDDLSFLLNGYPMKQTASQGQRKNFLFALKLAQYDILKSFKHFPPILLLDDIFEKLDHTRIAHLISLISGPDFGQVFITDTEEARLRAAFGSSHAQLQVIGL